MEDTSEEVRFVSVLVAFYFHHFFAALIKLYRYLYLVTNGLQTSISDYRRI